MATKVLRQAGRMRIIAIPLTSGASSSGANTYYHFQTPPSVKGKESPNLFKKATEKAAELWAGFGKAPEGSWKLRTFKYGEHLMDRIDFEELALKSMDPSLGPKLTRLGKSEVQIEKQNLLPIPLIHPAFFGSRSSPLSHLRGLLVKRTPAHRKGFYFWLIISPLTAPFMLIPVIPNLPFFFCAWRAWHHYKAFRASEYLESLASEGAIVPEHNIALDKIYETYGNENGSIKQTESGNEEKLILTKEAVPKIVSLFDLPSSASADLFRALDQTTARLEKTKTA